MMSSAHLSSPLLTLQVLCERLSGCGSRLYGSTDGKIDRITEDSRRVGPGCIFVARSGGAFDGRKFIAAALAQGASAILCERGGEVRQEPRIEVDDLRQAWGICAQVIYGSPAEKLNMIGLTGTNGKTTVASLLDQALTTLGQKVARSGTLGFFIGDEKISDSLTTPQPDALAQNLASAVARGASAAILEVSSHALSQKRCAAIQFSVVAFTNLTQDHLDYHITMEEYGAAKALLFREGNPKQQVLNIDDAFGRSLAAEFPQALTCSAQGAAAAQIHTIDATFSRSGIDAQIMALGQNVRLRSQLVGQHNLENLLVAWGVLIQMGIGSERAVSGLSQATGVAGRMQRCSCPEDDIVVFVDYAHTPDALTRALRTLKELDFAELSCVFGCGGDRDRAKRSLMGAAAAQLADKIYLTSDNPRTEDPFAIMQEVRTGWADLQNTTIEVDRRKAIFDAILGAKTGGVVLIAGKGHEDYQIIGHKTLPFDDSHEARDALQSRRLLRKS